MKYLIIALALMFAGPASARCLPEVQAHMQLTIQYGEEVIDEMDRPTPEFGVIRYRLYANAKRKSWTVTGTNSEGVTCGLSAGINYDGQTLADLFDGEAT